MRIILVLSLLFICTISHGQKIDNLSSFREISGEVYFRINYDNDLFAQQDKNYTQGYSLEFVSPILSRNPINKLFFNLRNDNRKAGIVFEHLGFTPDKYDEVEIQEDDRPFAGAAYLKSFSISTNQESKQRLASHLSIGIIGPAALGKEIQTSIHEATNGRVPRGWDNQIQDHPIINYGIDYEKEMLRVSDYFNIAANGSAMVGNMYTKASVGFNSSLGLIHNPYKNDQQKKFKIYTYLHTTVSLVGYDGTLQGDLFSDNSVHVISANEISRIVGQVNYGFVLQTEYIYLEYYRSHITKEIASLGPASWGGIRLGITGLI